LLNGHCTMQLNKCIEQQMFFSVTSNTKISINVIIDSPIVTSQMISNARITRKQQTGQSHLRDMTINRQGIEIVSIWQIYRATHQKLRNLKCQTGNFVAQQSRDKIVQLCHVSDMGLRQISSTFCNKIAIGS